MFWIGPLLKTIKDWFLPPVVEDEETHKKTEIIPPHPFAKPDDVPPDEYSPIWTALENRLDYLLRTEIPQHRKRVRSHVMELHYIQIECPNGDRGLLDRFALDYDEESRREWAKARINDYGHVNLDSFSGIVCDIRNANLDGLRVFESIMNGDLEAAYSIKLHGKWIREAEAKPSAKKRRGPRLKLSLNDAQAPRLMERDEYPMVLGYGEKYDVPVFGEKVSGRSGSGHMTLDYDGFRVLMTDHSKNGTWIDGNKANTHIPVELKGKASLRLGKEDGNIAEYPRIDLEILPEVFQESITTPLNLTPIEVSNLTPVIIPDTSRLLAELDIHDASGHLKKDILGVPFVIGRNPQLGYSVPGNAGVSGEHLVIEAITSEGAAVFNNAANKNGTALNGTLQGERFVWPFGAEVQLAPKWSKDPLTRLVLNRPQ